MPAAGRGRPFPAPQHLNPPARRDDVRDLFVPRIAYVNPEVRKKAVMKATDKNLLRQVIELRKEAGVTRWLFICLACHRIYDVGLTV